MIAVFDIVPPFGAASVARHVMLTIARSRDQGGESHFSNRYVIHGDARRTRHRTAASLQTRLTTFDVPKVRLTTETGREKAV